MKRSAAALTALHLAGNAILLYCGYLWLGMKESDNFHLVASFGFAFLLLLAAITLHAASFAYFEPHSLRKSLALALRRLAPLTLLVLLIIVIYWSLDYWRDHVAHRSFVIASWLTMTFRRPVAPQTIEGVFFGLIALLRWTIVPVIFLPIAARSPRRRTFLYCIEVTGLLLCGIWVPLKLANWAPALHTFGQQAISIVLRFAAGYCLFVAACLLIAFITSGGRPPATQPSTVVAP